MRCFVPAREATDWCEPTENCDRARTFCTKAARGANVNTSTLVYLVMTVQLFGIVFLLPKSAPENTQKISVCPTTSDA